MYLAKLKDNTLIEKKVYGRKEGRKGRQEEEEGREGKEEEKITGKKEESFEKNKGFLLS